jgi:hypothetical protein
MPLSHEEPRRHAHSTLCTVSSLDRSDDVRAPSVTERVEPLPIEEVALAPGARATLDVVLVNERVGHSFPGGTADVADVWIELTVRDARNRVVLQSGVAGRDGSADEDAHRLPREAYERHRFHDGVPGLRARCKREVPNCQRESEAVHTHPLR